jgi:hypothetical protein
MRDKSVTVTKRRIALIQLHRAVDLLINHDDPICALTLAGAAEEILGKIVEAKGLTNAHKEDAAFLKQVFEYVKHPLPADLSSRLNKQRNELKHNDGGKNKQVKADWRFEAEDMILRGIRNYQRAFGCTPRSKLVRQWWDWISL